MRLDIENQNLLKERHQHLQGKKIVDDQLIALKTDLVQTSLIFLLIVE